MKTRIGIIALLLSLILLFDNTNCSAVIWKYKSLPNIVLFHPNQVDHIGNSNEDSYSTIFYCSPKRHYIGIYSWGNIYGSSKVHYKLYRKKAGKKKYKRIKCKMIGRDFCETYGDDSYDVVADKTATPGKTYYYKARAYIKKGKKKIYSSMSDPFKMKAINDDGVYTVTSITPETAQTDNAIIKVKSHKGNVKTYFFGVFDYYGANGDSNCKIISYSCDNKKWTNSNRLCLKGGKTVYIKVQFVKDGKKNIIHFSGGNKTSHFEFDDESVDYKKTHYHGELSDIEGTLDLVSHKGKVEIDAEDDN